MNKNFFNKQVQIYILENNGGYIKIGVTTDFKQRLETLQGSNGGGHKIIKYYVSPETYLYSLEIVMHMIYADQRIKGTEWFEDLDFNEVVATLKELMSGREYERCNHARKEYYDYIMHKKIDNNMEDEIIWNI